MEDDKVIKDPEMKFCIHFLLLSESLHSFGSILLHLAKKEPLGVRVLWAQEHKAQELKPQYNNSLNCSEHWDTYVTQKHMQESRLTINTYKPVWPSQTCHNSWFYSNIVKNVLKCNRN